MDSSAYAKNLGFDAIVINSHQRLRDKTLEAIADYTQAIQINPQEAIASHLRRFGCHSRENGNPSGEEDYEVEDGFRVYAAPGMTITP